MIRRPRVSERPSDEDVSHYQGNTVLVECTQLWTAPASLDRSRFCGTTPYLYGACDVLWREERQG